MTEWTKILPEGAIILWQNNDIVWFCWGSDVMNLQYESVLSQYFVTVYQRGDLLIEAEEWR